MFPKLLHIPGMMFPKLLHDDVSSFELGGVGDLKPAIRVIYAFDELRKLTTVSNIHQPEFLVPKREICALSFFVRVSHAFAAAFLFGCNLLFSFNILTAVSCFFRLIF